MNLNKRLYCATCVLLGTLWALLFSMSVKAQDGKLNLYLKHIIAKHGATGQHIQLFVQGDANLLGPQVTRLGGQVKYSFRDYCAISIPAAKVQELAAYPGVKRIDCTVSKPDALMDQVYLHDRIAPVHNGDSTLLQGYTGKGVIMGIIDTGIDFNHPDFQDTLGNTRVLAVWDQTFAFDAQYTPQPYGYGQHWDSTDINASACPHVDVVSFGHGTNVSGIATGNGNALNDTVSPNYKGVAPDCDIVVVASDFWAANWQATVADAVDYIFHIADSLGRPCVINMSIGDYLGAHDGMGVYTQYMDSILEAKPGRMIVAAAGNSGNVPYYHLSYPVTSDTLWTWFRYNASSAIGQGVFFELWADTADFNNVSYAVGADKTSPTYNYRGRSQFANIGPTVGVTITDSIVNNGNVLAYVDTWAEEVNGRYRLQVVLFQPDSSQYDFRFMTTGSGSFDVWSANWLGMSDMPYTGLPDTTTFPDMLYYMLPDSNKSIVSNWACSDHTLTVANYFNRASYTDYDTVLQVTANPVGAIHPTSSRGPTRDNRVKPDVGAAGGLVLTTGTLARLASLIGSNPGLVANGGWHMVNGGTSMASPQVAGVVALLLEKCPTLTYDELIQAITQTAYADTNVWTIPNYRWGYGKLDAFAAALGTNFNPMIGTTGLEMCSGDSVQLSLNGYSQVVWSTTDTVSNIYSAIAGMYSAWVTDSAGCQAPSDTVSTIVHSLPTAPTITADTTVICDGDTANFSIPASYSSYSWSNGDSTAGASVMVAGSYWVQVTDTNGCSNYSDTLGLIVNPLPAPIVSVTGDTVLSTPAVQYQWLLDGNPIAGATGQQHTADSVGWYSVWVTDTNGCSATSDSVFVNPIGLEEYEGDGQVSVYPNPTSGSFVISLTGFADEVLDIRLVNLIGQEIYALKTASLKAQQSLEIGMNGQAKGPYFLYIRSHVRNYTQKIVYH